MHRRPSHGRRLSDAAAAWLDAAVSPDGLRSPPGNRLESLHGDRTGEYSIRVNDQYRLCFVWTPSGPEQVECVDYHY